MLCYGGAFKKKYQFDSEGEKNRFFFILNATPKQSITLVCVTPTTQNKSRRALCRHRDEDLAIIKNSEYGSLPAYESTVDCGTIIEFAYDDFIKDVYSGDIEPLEKLPSVIIDTLVNKALASVVVEQELKDRIPPVQT